MAILSVTNNLMTHLVDQSNASESGRLSMSIIDVIERFSSKLRLPDNLPFIDFETRMMATRVSPKVVTFLTINVEVTHSFEITS